jgi:hypothetical protein
VRRLRQPRLPSPIRSRAASLFIASYLHRLIPRARARVRPAPVVPSTQTVRRQHALFLSPQFRATPDALASIRAVSFASGGVSRDFEVITSWHARHLTNRWSQPLAAVLKG